MVEKIMEHKKSDVMYLAFRLLSFFMKVQGIQAEIVSMQFVKVLFNSLKDASSIDRKFILSIILDMLGN